MKTKAKRHDVAISGFEGFSFSAEMNAEMFDLLINKMYSNKIQAVVRELGANAVDSHIAAGHKKNFHIQIPTYENKEFIIRDYGVGLTPEEVKELYTVLGRSSKRETNDQIGCIGIGSKSPFAYTKKFFIVSYKDGFKHTYCAYIDNDNLPKIAIMEESAKTNEPNGLEIKVPVHPHDFTKFVQEIQSVYEFFEIRPNIETQSAEYNIDTKYIKVQKRSDQNTYRYRYSYGYAPTIRIIMGGIKYEFNSSYFDTKIQSLSVDLFFDIGELDVAGNREGLSYNDTTIAAIKNRLKEAEELISKEYSKNINNAKCEFEAYLLSKEYSNIGVTLNYNNQKIRNSFTHETSNRVIKFSHGSKDEYQYNGKYKINISITKNPIIVINDLKRGGISRTKKYSATSHEECFLFFSEDKKELKALLDDLGLNNSYVKKVSDFPKPESKKKKEVNLYKFREYTAFYRGYSQSEFDDYLYHYWSEISPDDEDLTNIYYVTYDRGRFLNGDTRQHPAYLKYITQLMGIKTLYGIPKSAEDDLDFKGKNLIDEFSQYKVKQSFNSVIDDYDIKQYKALSNISQYCPDIKAFVDKVNKFKPPSEKTRTALRKVNNIIKLKEPKQENFEDEYKKILNKYPILNHITNLTSKEVQNQLSYYFKGLNK